ncbi:MAG: Uncharacterized protein JWR32_1292 [Mycobacterium sp.]|jgi:hypothetical protein|nr:Uncharacterized protein [Mycobacterium sp.]
MNQYLIERHGGFAGLKATATVPGDALNPTDRAALDQLLDTKQPLARDPGADRYTYVVTRRGASAETTREVPESMMPDSVASLVREQI